MQPGMLTIRNIAFAASDCREDLSASFQLPRPTYLTCQVRGAEFDFTWLSLPDVLLVREILQRFVPGWL